MNSVRVAISFSLIFVTASPAFGALQLSEYDNGTSILRSYYDVQASNRLTGDSKRDELPAIPFSFPVSASVVGATIEDIYSWNSESFTMNFNRHDKSGGSFVASSGAMIFSVNKVGTYILDGMYSVATSGVQDIQLRTTWQDLTDNKIAYSSNQWDAAAGGNYFLGGLKGNREATVNGSSTNELVLNHTYRILWTASIDNLAPGAYDAFATGSITLSAVPEPGTFILFENAGMLLAAAACLRSLRNNSKIDLPKQLGLSPPKHSLNRTYRGRPIFRSQNPSQNSSST